MITKGDFAKVIEKIQKHEASIDEMYDNKALSVDYISDHTYWASEVIFSLLNVLFTEKGSDWISWWLYEKYDHTYKAYNENEEEISTETIDDLWNIVEKYRK